MSPMRIACLLVLILFSTNGLALAEGPVLTPLGDLGNKDAADPLMHIDCQVGNQEAGQWSIKDWITGDQTFSYFINAKDEGCCQSGLIIGWVHMVLDFREAATPQTFLATAALKEAVWNEEKSCWMPGDDVVNGGEFGVAVFQPFLFDVGLPLGGDSVPVDQNYFLTITLTGEVDCGMVLDGTPDSGNDWQLVGDVWRDMDDLGFAGYGDILMYGRAGCENLVSNSEADWSQIKSYYR